MPDRISASPPRGGEPWWCVPALAAAALLALPAAAEAHVKWFAPYDIGALPKPVTEIVPTAAFLALTTVAVLAFLGACHVERTRLGDAVVRALDAVSAGLRCRSEDMIRAGTAAFMVSLFAMGGVIITPELRTEAGWVPWLQAAIALGMFWRPTLPLSALGIAALWVYGAAQYSLFHMMDYPIFLGLAAYLAMSASRDPAVLARRLPVARCGAAVTLMWASVEKWAFPQWTAPVVENHPWLAMSLDFDTFMVLAGVVEFALAFALVWTPLARRLSALVLAAMFALAVIPFGKIDAIGHLMIIVLLLAIVADDTRGRGFVRLPFAPLAKVGALALTLVAYVGLHGLLVPAALTGAAASWAAATTASDGGHEHAALDHGAATPGIGEQP